MHININGLKTNKTELELYTEETKPDILCINETKTGSQPPSKLLGYNLTTYRNRTTGLLAGGGVAIYCRDSITATDIDINKDDICGVEVTDGKNTIGIITYYCPPSKNTEIDTK